MKPVVLIIVGDGQKWKLCRYAEGQKITTATLEVAGCGKNAVQQAIEMYRVGK